MDYCTLEDIQAAFPSLNIIQLTDDEGTNEIDTGKVTKAIQNADAMIDGFLRGKYILPLNPVPEEINRISIDLAIFYLYDRRYEMETPEGMKDRYKRCVDRLKNIQKGIETLPDVNKIISSDGSITGTFRTNKTAEDRIFSKTLLSKFRL